MATRVALVGQPCKAEILRHPCDLVIGLSGIQRYPKLFALEQFWVRKDIGKVHCKGSFLGSIMDPDCVCSEKGWLEQIAYNTGTSRGSDPSDVMAQRAESEGICSQGG